MSRNLTDGGDRVVARVRVDELLDDRIDFAGAGRVRDDADDETEGAR